MKLNLGKRLVLFLHWLLSLVACVLAVGLSLWPEKVHALADQADLLFGGYGDIVAIAAAAVYVLLAVLSVIFILSGRKNRSDRSFITVDSNEAGRTRIAISAVDQMIREAVRGVEGIVEMKSGIVSSEDSISINASVSVVSGAHVPTVTMNMQRAIRGYIELNCGVAVREVSISVNSLESADAGAKGRRRGAPAAAAAPVAPAPAVKPEVIAQETPVLEANPVEEAVEAVPAEEAVEVLEAEETVAECE